VNFCPVVTLTKLVLVLLFSPLLSATTSRFKDRLEILPLSAQVMASFLIKVAAGEWEEVRVMAQQYLKGRR
jgi:hypothetical protein